MIMFDIAEWIANFLILGIGICIWAVAIFMVTMILTMANKWIEEFTKKRRQNVS
tara:strand:- start:1201 stop:1362 length:162 start_codon:yes stop_codon:yes gene_type:complete